MRRDIDKRANVENEGGDAYYEALLTKEVARGWGYLGKLPFLHFRHMLILFRYGGTVYGGKRT